MNRFKFLFIFLVTWFICIPSKSQYFYSFDNGINQQIRDIAVDSANNLVYVVGNFLSPDGYGWQNSFGILRWDETKWDSVGKSFPALNCIAAYNGKIYVGAYSHLLIFDGVQWDTLFADEQILDLEVVNDDLFVMGVFDTLNGMPANRLARFDGTSWFAYPPIMANSIYGSINAVAIYNGELYVGGNFECLCGSNVYDIARFDGAGWNSVGAGLSGSNSIIDDLEVYNNILYVGGYFLTSFGDPGNCIASWDGNVWSSPGTGMNGQIFDLHEFQGNLWAGGSFTVADGIPCYRTAIYNGVTWEESGANCDNGVTTFASSGNSIYLGGGFKTINSDTVNHVCLMSTSPLNVESFENSVAKIYPNPTNEIFTFMVHLVNFAEVKTEIFDLKGMSVFAMISTANPGINKLVIDPGRIANGIYFLKLEYCDKIIVKKIVFQ